MNWIRLAVYTLVASGPIIGLCQAAVWMWDGVWPALSVADALRFAGLNVPKTDVAGFERPVEVLGAFPLAVVLWILALIVLARYWIWTRAPGTEA